MTAHEQSNNQGVQVDSSLYTTAGYCIPGRFAAYAYQIQEILNCGAKTVLEIGPGNGVVTYVLRKAGIHVDTLDHDPALKTDLVASVLDLPFQPNSYDAVLCCQVLEHIPWNMFQQAIKEITRLTREIAVISMPHRSRHYYIDFKLPKIKKIKWSIDIPLKGHTQFEFNGEHYWEIGMGIDEDDIIATIQKTGCKAIKSYRVPEFLCHHFFILSAR